MCYDWLHISCCCFVLNRLKKKSQSVDIATQRFSPTLVPASPHKTEPPVTKTTTLGVQQNNATNSQRICSPRCGELKRGYTIGKWKVLEFWSAHLCGPCSMFLHLAFLRDTSLWQEEEGMLEGVCVRVCVCTCVGVHVCRCIVRRLTDWTSRWPQIKSNQMYLSHTHG